MLSILIPAYNYDVTALVAGLHRQATESGIGFEILVMEDGSTRFVNENAAINALPFCRHIHVMQNAGRSAVRNRLADEARYPYLLFMDCDAAIYSPDFIKNYLPSCQEGCAVIGGTAYDEAENNPAFSLRLAYGRQREARPAAERSKEGAYHNFATFNFLISKSLFNKVRFDETIRGYGHEDTVFGHSLHEAGFGFTHIENPLLHMGLDDNYSFIRKTEEGTRNLYLLYRTGQYPFLANESKLLNTFLTIQKLRLTALFAFKFKLTRKFMQRALYSPAPSLLLYDLYKLLFLCNTAAQK